jgi:hypothetical protein
MKTISLARRLRRALNTARRVANTCNPMRPHQK